MDEYEETSFLIKPVVQKEETLVVDLKIHDTEREQGHQIHPKFDWESHLIKPSIWWFILS